MSIDSYSDLRVAIQQWMFDRSDLATFCADFIALCEADINLVLRARRQIKTATLSLDTDSRATIPSDYLEFRNVTALTSPRRRLEAVAPGTRDDAYPFRQAGFPSVFSVEGNEIMVLPMTTADIEMEYFAKVPALSEDEPSNWLLEKVPNLYLFGSLKHANAFISNMDRASMFGGLFNGVLDALVRDEKSGVWSRGKARVAMVTP